jgi:hypothetical protein
MVVVVVVVVEEFPTGKVRNLVLYLERTKGPKIWSSLDTCWSLRSERVREYRIYPCERIAGNVGRSLPVVSKSNLSISHSQEITEHSSMLASRSSKSLSWYFIISIDMEDFKVEGHRGNGCLEPGVVNTDDCKVYTMFRERHQLIGPSHRSTLWDKCRFAKFWGLDLATQ